MSIVKLAVVVCFVKLAAVILCEVDSSGFSDVNSSDSTLLTDICDSVSIPCLVQYWYDGGFKVTYNAWLKV